MMTGTEFDWIEVESRGQDGFAERDATKNNKEKKREMAAT